MPGRKHLITKDPIYYWRF